jgi:thioredoxin reductase (NADPH)
MIAVDVLILGAGPIGLSAGIAAQKEGLRYQIIDKGCLVNSLHNFPTDMTFFSSSDKLEIGNIPFHSLSRRPRKQEALEYYRRVTEHFNLNVGLYETFLSAEKQIDGNTGFIVSTTKTKYRCRYIVNATGFYDTPVLMNIPGEKLQKVNHYFDSAHHLFRQKVAIIGASNSAIDAALEAYRKGADVSLIIRKDKIGNNVKYWIRPDVEARIAEGSIKAYYQAEVNEIHEKFILVQQDGKRFKMENDFVYAMTGYRPNFDLLRLLNIEVDVQSTQPLYNFETMESSNSGVYIAGVVCGGLKTKEWFIENSRDHGAKIMSHIKKQQK